MKKLIGIILLCSPFIAMFTYGITEAGLRDTLIAFGITFMIIVIVALGLILIKE